MKNRLEKLRKAHGLRQVVRGCAAMVFDGGGVVVYRLGRAALDNAAGGHNVHTEKRFGCLSGRSVSQREM